MLARKVYRNPAISQHYARANHMKSSLLFRNDTCIRIPVACECRILCVSVVDASRRPRPGPCVNIANVSPVYEFICRNVAVMRRRSDGYLNATQILKVAGFDKPQRTRVLEREVQKGEHEKVQGGYGKYQGAFS